MLRILHTADWHLGQSFHGYDRDYEHVQFLGWLRQTIVERQTDVLLIAGDVFDSVNPSATSQRRVYEFFARVHADRPALQIVLIAGNHDAAARLEAPAGIFQCLGIHVVGTVGRLSSGDIDFSKFLIPLKDAAGQVQAIALAVPFLRPSDVPEVPGAPDNYLAGIRALYHHAVQEALAFRDRECPQAALLALGHCHMHDAAESRDSERRIVIGTAEALHTETFPGDLAYVALGHLHQPQELDGGRICYSGSPLPLSFSECDYAHRVLELCVEGRAVVSVASLPIPKTVSLLRLPPAALPIAEVMQMLATTPFDTALSPEAYPFLEVRVLDDGPDPTRRRRIEQTLAGRPVRLARIKPEMLRPSAADAPDAPSAALDDLGSLDPEQIMIAAHQERYGTVPDAALLGALREILAAEAPASPPAP
jgi:DNA repair protein SbcD/Mre11